MPHNHNRKFLGFILLLLIATPFILGQSYPPPTAYPGPPTQPYATAYPRPFTETPNLPTSVPATFTPPAYQAPVTSQTESITLAPTQANNTFLTENAEMGQSQATLVPSDTPLVSPTITNSPLPTNLIPLPGDTQSFAMNWGAFILGFIAVILIGGAVGWWFLYRQRSPA